MTDVRDFSVSSSELQLLMNVLACEPKFAPQLSAAEKRYTKMVIRFSRVEAEEVSNYLTTELARSGFDQNYFVNERGVMLESLIDRLFDIYVRAGDTPPS